MLHFPHSNQIDRRFAVSLMCKVNHLTRSLVLGRERVIKFNKADINKVFGIPCSGRQIEDCTSKRTVQMILSEYLSNRIKNRRSMKPAIEIISRDCNDITTEADVNSFKVAFVIFIMSTVLTPGPKFDYISYDYWNAIENPSKISTFDWCEYVMHKLLDGVVKLKSKLKCNSKIANITGCALFLQVQCYNLIPANSTNTPSIKKMYPWKTNLVFFWN